MFKGTVSRDGYFYEGIKILIHTFQGLSKAFHYLTQLLTFYLLLWVYLLILKMITETLLRIIFSVIGRCSHVPTSDWLQEKCARINLLQAASNMILPNHRRLSASIFSVKIAALGSLKRVTGKIFKISNLFQRCKIKKCKILYQRKYLFIIICLQKIFISWHNNLICNIFW